MKVQRPHEDEHFVGKLVIDEKRKVKKKRRKMNKENQTSSDDKNKPTRLMSQAIKAFADVHSLFIKEDFKDKFFKLIAREEGKALRKEARAEQPKNVKSIQETVEPIVEKNKEPEVEKPPKYPKKNMIAARKAKAKLKAKRDWDKIYQRFLELTDQELAAEFVSNFYTSFETEPKLEPWCTFCHMKFKKNFGLNQHFKKKHRQLSSNDPEEEAESLVVDCDLFI